MCNSVSSAFRPSTWSGCWPAPVEDSVTAASTMLSAEFSTSNWIARWMRKRSRFSLPWVAYTLRSSVHGSQSAHLMMAVSAHDIIMHGALPYMISIAPPRRSTPCSARNPAAGSSRWCNTPVLEIRS
jgi:hypothetical protein